MKNLIKIMALILLTIPEILISQTQLTVKNKHDLTVKRLEFARDVEASFPDAHARDLLNQAEEILRKAYNTIVSGDNLLANRQIDSANILMNNALKIILNNPIRRQREKLKETFQLADNIVLGSGNQKAEQLLRDAKNHELTATDLFKKQRYQLALEHFRLAFFLANRAIDIAKNQNQNIQQQALDEKQRLEQLREKAQKEVEKSQNPTALKLFRQAENQIRKTQQLFNEKNYTQAIEHYHRATRLLLRAIDISSSKNEKTTMAAYDEVIVLDELIESVQTKIEEANLRDDNRITFLEDRILDHQQKAHQALEEKQYQVAQLNMQMARNLVERTLQILNRNQGYRFVGRIQTEFDQLNLNLEEISTKVTDSRNEEAKVLLDLAYRARDRAQTLFERGRQQLALGAIAIANRLAFKAEQLIIESGTSALQPEVVENNLSRVAQKIAELKSESVQSSVRDRFLINEAEKIYDIGFNAFNKGMLNVAQECAEIAERYLSRISDNQ